MLVEAIALTDKGTVDAGRWQMSRPVDWPNWYAVVRDSAKPHDATFKLKCEQRKTWEGTTAAGGDADLPDAPSRLWKGPACQLMYLLGETRIKWQKEVRTDFEDAAAAALSANAGDPGAYAMAKLRRSLSSTISRSAGCRVGSSRSTAETAGCCRHAAGAQDQNHLAAGEMQADEALPKLKAALKDKNLSKEAAVALGSMGKEEFPFLSTF